MTFKQLLEANATLKIVFNSTKITDFDQAVIIADFQEDIEKALKLLEAGQKALVKPYENKAKERATESNPNGFNTPAELEEFNVLKEDHFDKDIPIFLGCANGQWQKTTLDELLPYAFDEKLP
jgi:hypothetical protein